MTKMAPVDKKFLWDIFNKYVDSQMHAFVRWFSRQKHYCYDLISFQRLQIYNSKFMFLSSRDAVRVMHAYV
jgi:hypothetical protein